MAKRVVPKRKLPLHIKDWLEIRGMKPVDLADALGVAEATVSRWISGARRPDSGTIRAIEEVLQLSPGGLHRKPTEAARAELLAGLTPDKQKDALRFIEYLRTRGD